MNYDYYTNNRKVLMLFSKWASVGIKEEEFFEDMYILVIEVIKELLPQIMNDIQVNIETRLNGKVISSKEIQEEVKRLILEHFSN